MEVLEHQKQRIIEYEQEGFSDGRAPHPKALIKRHYAGDLVAQILTKIEYVPSWLRYTMHCEFRKKTLQTHNGNRFSLKMAFSGFWPL